MDNPEVRSNLNGLLENLENEHIRMDQQVDELEQEKKLLEEKVDKVKKERIATEKELNQIKTDCFIFNREIAELMTSDPLTDDDDASELRREMQEKESINAKITELQQLAEYFTEFNKKFNNTDSYLKSVSSAEMLGAAGDRLFTIGAELEQTTEKMEKMTREQGTLEEILADNERLRQQQEKMVREQEELDTECEELHVIAQERRSIWTRNIMNKRIENKRMKAQKTRLQNFLVKFRSKVRSKKNRPNKVKRRK